MAARVNLLNLMKSHKQMLKHHIGTGHRWHGSKILHQVSTCRHVHDPKSHDYVATDLLVENHFLASPRPQQHQDQETRQEQRNRIGGELAGNSGVGFGSALSEGGMFNQDAAAAGNATTPAETNADNSSSSQEPIESGGR